MHALGLSLGNTLGNYTAMAAARPIRIDLNGASAGLDIAWPFFDGDASAYVCPFATVAISDPVTALSSLTIVADGLADGATEYLEFGALQIASDDVDSSTNVVAGGITFSVAWTLSSTTIVATKSGGGTFPAADAEALLQMFAYWNDTVSMTYGERTFTVTATNGTYTSATSRAYVTVGILPIVDLNGGGSGVNTSFNWVWGDGETTVASSATVSASTGTLDSLEIVGGGILDGTYEILTICGEPFPLASDKTADVIAGGTTFEVAYTTATQTFAITKQGIGTFTDTACQTLVRSIAYDNQDSGGLADGSRTFAFTATNVMGDSATATATIAVYATAPLLSATTLRMSHLSAGRPYVTFLAPAETNADGLRRLHLKTFADSAS